MTFTGRGGFEDTSDRSSWARSVEGRLAKVVARIQSADIVDGAVTTAKVLDRAITAAKIALGTLTMDLVLSEPWFDYTPTNTNVTIGNGTQVARWNRIGRAIRVQYALTWGSTTAFGGNPFIGLPTPATGRHQGAAVLLDSGTRFYVGVVCITPGSGTSAVDVFHSEAGNAGIVNATNPMTWTTGDLLSFSLLYESAS